MPVTRRGACDKKRVAEAFEQIDAFGVPVKFNYAGKSQIKSGPGAFVTIMLGLVLGAFAFQRFQELIYH